MNEIFNPYPGLRPFEAHEDYLFFGREEHTDELLRRLRKHRFLAVIGESGSGKSSLVRAGMLPALHGGFLAGAGSDWRIAVLRPGGDPIGNLAAALAEVLDPDSDSPSPEGRGGQGGEDSLFRDMAAASLRRSRLALAQLAREARLAAGENLLILVDQFEELFRFRREQASGNVDEAVAFANLLLAAAGAAGLPLFVVITMRSDFLGDCTQIPGLPEAINAGLYLIPRLDRPQRERAIVGPAGVGGARLDPPLVQQLLNDIGDDPDQLPILQHALMRTFDRWLAAGNAARPLGLADYQAIGTLREALSRHAEEAFAELPPRLHPVAEKVLKALTEIGPSGRGVRRPATLASLAAIAGGAPEEVAAVADVFRAPGRSFLMPPAEVALEPASMIDISHESLMRTWERLAAWTRKEKVSVDLYRRVKETAELAAAGRAGLWHDPDLRIALDWRAANQPTAAWAERYGGGFGAAMGFLDASQKAAEEAAAAALAAQRKEIRNARLITAATALALLFALGFIAYAWIQNNRMERQNRVVRSRQLALLAAEREDDDHELALLLAIEAGHAAHTVEAENVLRRQLRHAGRTVGLLARQGDDLVRVGFSASDGRLLVASRDGRAYIFDPRRPQEPPCTLKGHDAAIWAASFSPDGRRVVTAAGDGTARLWDPGACQPLQVLAGHETLVPAATWDARGERLATVGFDQTARLWSVADGRQLQVLPHQGQVLNARWLGDLVATTDLSPAVQVFDSRDGRRIADYPEKLWRPVRQLAVLPGSGGGPPWLLLGGDDGRLRWWNLAESGTAPAEAWHRDWITGVWPSPVPTADGKWRILTTSRDRTARFWTFDPAAPPAQRLRPGALLRHGGGVGRAAWAKDGERVATASDDFLVRVFRYSEPRPEVVLTGHHGAVLDVAWSPDGTMVATASEDDSVRIWDPAPGVEAAELARHHGAVWQAAFSPDSRRVATVGQDARLQLADVDGGRPVAVQLDRPALAVAWDPAGGRLAVAGRRGLLELRGDQDGRLLFALPAPDGSLTRVAFSRDGSRLAVAGRTREAALYELGAAGGRRIAELPHERAVTDLAFSPDGRKLATAGVDTRLRVWDGTSGALLKRFDGHTSAILDLDWDGAGRRIATGSSDRSVRIWDVEHLAPAPLQVLVGHDDWVFAVAWGPFGKRLASASKDTSARLWDGATGAALATMPNHSQPVRHLLWTPDGERLVTASDDHTARLWQTAEGRSDAVLTGHQAAISVLATSPDGSRILTGDMAGRVLVDFARTEDFLATACQRIVRQLSEEEWRLYGDGGPWRPTCEEAAK